MLWHREDPEGIFYYKEASDMSGNAKAKILKVVSNGTTYLHIKFYTDNESETYAEVGCVLILSLLSLTLLHQFIAEDPVCVFSPHLFVA